MTRVPTVGPLPADWVGPVDYLPAKDVAVQVRGALGACFSGVKFSVRTSTYSLGASIDVSWTDGPTGNGTDRFADEWARARREQGQPVTYERVPPDWQAYSPSLRRLAPLARNVAMVKSGADLCLAFFHPGAKNSGTTHCSKHARRAGIQVRQIWGERQCVSS